MLEPRYHEFTIADASGSYVIACMEWGDPQAEHTVVCVHGLTRNGRDFDLLAQALATDYRVLCPDMRGRGRSQWMKDPAGYSNPTYISDVQAILRAKGISRVHWVGTSMGGIMGMMVPNLAPGLIDKLVLNDIGCVIPAEGVGRIRDIADIKTSFDTLAEAEDALRKRCQFFGIHEEAHWQHLFQFGVGYHNEQWVFTYDPAIFASGFSKDTPLADIDLWALWPALAAIPVLLIRGAESDILLHSTALEMQSRHPRLNLHEIPGVGHAPALMDESQIMLIKQWLGIKSAR